MFREQARRFVSEMADYAFHRHADADDNRTFVHAGPLDLKSLGRFKAGHQACPGDVLPVPFIDATASEDGEEETSGEELEVEGEDQNAHGDPSLHPTFTPSSLPHVRPQPSPFQVVCWTAIEIVYLLCLLLFVIVSAYALASGVYTVLKGVAVDVICRYS